MGNLKQPQVEANEILNPSSKTLSHKMLQKFNKQQHDEELQQQQLRQKIQEQIALSQEYHKNERKRLINDDTVDTESYIESVIYTDDESTSIQYDDESTDDEDTNNKKKHKSI